MIEIDWEKYYTMEEAIVISDENIKRSAEELILELRKAKASIRNSQEVYV